MKVTVDQDKCIGCGVCISICPDVYELNDDNKAAVKDDADFDSCDLDESIDKCPTAAIEEE